jgi:hypothetical protein
MKNAKVDLNQISEFSNMDEKARIALVKEIERMKSK